MDIKQHQFAWRWTDSRYTVLPNEVLKQMHPLGMNESADASKQSLMLLGNETLSPALNPVVVPTVQLSREAGTSWLLQQQPDVGTLVTLSWDQKIAITTSWGIFAEHWPEFCYPASDGLVVFPESRNWALLYHHEEEFHFGKIGA